MLGILSALSIILVIVIMVLGIFINGAIHNANKIRYGVPWMQWLTLDEIVEMGHSRFWAEFLLPFFYRKGYVQIRMSEKLGKFERLKAEEQGLTAHTVSLYEYKFTESWRKGKKKPFKFRMPILEPMRL